MIKHYPICIKRGNLPIRAVEKNAFAQILRNDELVSDPYMDKYNLAYNKKYGFCVCIQCGVILAQMDYNFQKFNNHFKNHAKFDEGFTIAILEESVQCFTSQYGIGSNLDTQIGENRNILPVGGLPFFTEKGYSCLICEKPLYACLMEGGIWTHFKNAHPNINSDLNTSRTYVQLREKKPYSVYFAVKPSVVQPALQELGLNELLADLEADMYDMNVENENIETIHDGFESMFEWRTFVKNNIPADLYNFLKAPTEPILSEKLSIVAVNYLKTVFQVPEGEIKDPFLYAMVGQTDEYVGSIINNIRDPLKMLKILKRPKTIEKYAVTLSLMLKFFIKCKQLDNIMRLRFTYLDYCQEETNIFYQSLQDIDVEDGAQLFPQVQHYLEFIFNSHTTMDTNPVYLFLAVFFGNLWHRRGLSPT